MAAWHLKHSKICGDGMCTACLLELNYLPSVPTCSPFKLNGLRGIVQKAKEKTTRWCAACFDDCVLEVDLGTSQCGADFGYKRHKQAKLDAHRQSPHCLLKVPSPTSKKQRLFQAPFQSKSFPGIAPGLEGAQLVSQCSWAVPYTCKVSSGAHAIYHLGYWAEAPSHPYHLVAKQAGQRLQLVRVFASKHPQAPRGLTSRQRLLPTAGSGETLQSWQQQMTLLMCWRRVAATLSSHSGDTSASWSMHPTFTRSTESCGGASCTAACYVGLTGHTYANVKSRHTCVMT